MEIINPWLLYLVLQADNIRDTIDSLGGFLSWVSGLAWLVYIVAMFVYKMESNSTSYGSSDSYRKSCAATFTSLANSWKRMVMLPLLAITFTMAGAMIPSTKSAAMLLVIPTIANSEVVQQEARELYDLAKLGLKELVDQPAEKPVPPEVQAMRDAAGMK